MHLVHVTRATKLGDDDITIVFRRAATSAPLATIESSAAMGWLCRFCMTARQCFD
jgi:hypothetical protein